MTALTELMDLRGKTTQGTWKREAMGGSSTVLVPDGQHGQIAYGYDEKRGYCVSMPFTYEVAYSGGRQDIRMDITSFRHGDANFIVAAHTKLPEIAERVAKLEAVAAAAKRVDKMRVHGFGEHQHLEPYTEQAEALEAVRVALAALSGSGE